MTRINLVPPEELHDKHLLAEYRELPRIFRLARRAPEAPEVYTLGRGHVMFFYDKLAFLAQRQRSLINEMIRRGFRPQFTNIDELLNSCPDEFKGDYVPTPAALALNRERILARQPQERK